MAKTRKIYILLAALLCVAMSIGVLVACNPSGGDNNVTFMVDGQQYGTVAEIVDGRVSIPENPHKEYYSFRTWYTTEDFKDGTEFRNDNLEGKIVVYARFVPLEVTVNIDGQDKGVKNLVDVIADTEAGKYDTKDDLEFDGWYTDPGCTVKFIEGDDATALYGRFMARISFDNGHEQVWSTAIVPGTNVPNPALITDEDGEGTIESDRIIKWYMGINLIRYFDTNGDEIDFETYTADKNTVITVKWATPFTYKLNESTGKYYVYQLNYALNPKEPGILDSMQFREIPAISIAGKDRIKENGVWKTIDVEAVGSALFTFTQFSNIQTIIIDEGIKSIYGCFKGGSSLVNKIVLPSTLKIVENSFTGMSNLEELTLPEGLEIIDASFMGGADRSKPMNFNVKVPSSVKSLSRISNNFDFSENKNFSEDNGVIWKNEGDSKILVADFNVDDQGQLNVPDTVTCIQVGAFMMQPFDFLILPKSWASVSVNGSIYDYPYHKGYCLADRAIVERKNIDGITSSNQFPAYAVYNLSDSDNHAYVVIHDKSLNDNLPECAIMGYQTIVRSYKDDMYITRIICDGKVESGQQVKIYVSWSNWMLGTSGDLIFEHTSCSKLTEDELRGKLGIKDEVTIVKNGENKKATTTKLSSVTQFNKDYKLGSDVDTNLYLNVVWEYTVEGMGLTHTENNGEMTITGFEKDKAFLLGEGKGYLIQIPSEIDGKPVTKIADKAFSGNEYIRYAIVPSSVKEIGDYAFSNTPNLTAVRIATGGLETIGKYAFADSGFTTIQLPVGALKSVGECAFKSKKLTRFMAAAGEEDRLLYSVSGNRTSIPYEGLKEGMFFIDDTLSSPNVTVSYGSYLIQYKNTTVEKQSDPMTGGTVDINVYNVKLISACTSTDVRTFTLGRSARRSSVSGSTDSIMRFEVMPGSIAYLNLKKTTMYFVAVDKVHKGAFVDCTEPKVSGEKTPNIQYYHGNNASVDDKWLELTDITEINDKIFEDGWWNNVMKSDSEKYENIKKFMAGAQTYSSMLY